MGSKIKKIIITANKLVGAPYRRGAYLETNQNKIPSGFDCSSLIQHIFMTAGILVPRSSILQAARGEEVSPNKLLPGDLIFFESTRGHYWHSLFGGRKLYIGHVALYLGNGDVLDTNEDRGFAAIIKLSKITKNPSYKIVLVKRLIGITEPIFNVPAYSQLMDIKDADWKKRSCGLVALKMVMDYWGNMNGKKYPEINELLRESIKTAYINKVGWSHKGLARIAVRYGLKGQNFDWAAYSTHDAEELLRAKLKTAPLLASIHKGFNKANDGHLIVITGIKDNQVHFNDPDSNSRSKIKCAVPAETFLAGWKKRIIVIKP